MTWEQAQDALAAAMARSAAIERKRARERDGVYPGGLMSASRPGPKEWATPRTNAGNKAREIYAANPGITAAELARQSGLSTSACRDIVNGRARRDRPPAVSELARKARLIAAANHGMSSHMLAAQVGLSVSRCRALLRELRGPRAGHAKPPSEARLMAERLIREGKGSDEVASLTGISDRHVRKIRRHMMDRGETLPEPTTRRAPPPPKVSPAGLRARKILAINPDIGYRALATQSGLSRNGARDLILKQRKGA